MPTPVAYSQSQTQIGIAIEATRGTPVAPTYYIKVKNPKYKPDLTFNPDDTLQGSMVKTYNLVPGMRFDSHGWDSYPVMDSFPVLLRALLGSADTKTTAPTSTTLAALAAAGATTVQTTATIAAGSWIVIGSGATLETHLTTAVSGAGPYTVTLAVPLLYGQASGATVTGLTKHQVGLLNNAGTSGNQSPTCTLYDFIGDAWRQLPAATLDSVTIKATATGIVDYSCNWLANAASTPTTPTPSFTSVQAQPGWTTQVLFNGAQISTWVQWELTLKRNVKPIPALTGNQQYMLYFQNALEATGKVTVLLQNGTAELNNYLAGTIVPLEFTTYDMTNGYALDLKCSNAQFKANGGFDRSKEWVEIPFDVQLLPSATDALAGGVSPIVTTVANAITTTY